MQFLQYNKKISAKTAIANSEKNMKYLKVKAINFPNTKEVEVLDFNRNIKSKKNTATKIY